MTNIKIIQVYANDIEQKKSFELVASLVTEKKDNLTGLFLCSCPDIEIVKNNLVNLMLKNKNLKNLIIDILGEFIKRDLINDLKEESNKNK